MKKIILLMCLLFLPKNSMAASINTFFDDLKIGAEFDASSKYIGKGKAKTKNPVLQPFLWMEYFDVKGTLWSSLPTAGNDKIHEPDMTKYPNEIVPSLSYEKKFNKFTISPKLSYYLYEAKTWVNFYEGNLCFNYEVFDHIKIFTNHSYSFGAQRNAWNKMYFADYGIRSEYYLNTELSLSNTNKKYNLNYFNREESLVNSLNIKADYFYYLMKTVYVKPHLELSKLFIDQKVYNKDIVFSFGVGVGGYY